MKRLGVIAFVVVAACTSCTSGSSSSGASGGNDGPSVTQLGEPTEAVGKDLMLALGQAKNLHHRAKVLMADGDVAGAIASVRQILTLRFPAGAPEADDVRADARALLAKLLVGQGQLDEALRTVDEGLAEASRDSFFVANLYTVEGEVREARAAKLAGADATAERHAALEAFDKSLKIDEALQKKLAAEGK